MSDKGTPHGPAGAPKGPNRPPPYRMVSITYKNINIIASDKRIIKRVKKVLDFLELKDSVQFDSVTNLLEKITITPVLKNYNETRVKTGEWITSPEIFIQKNINIPYLASLLIHEAHHVAQYRTGHKYYGKKAELMAMKRQQKFLRKIGDDFSIQWLEGQFKKKWWKILDSKKRILNLN